MGIKGILPKLEKITYPVDLESCRGQKMGVDASAWLYKGAYGCASDLANNVDTSAYVDYFMSKVNLFLFFSIELMVVFDGKSHMLKEETQKSRRKYRELQLQKGKDLQAKGHPKEAWQCFTSSITITSTMTRKVQAALRSRNVPFIVAPYEADAQLAYLALTGEVDAVVSEDSDFLAYGCPRMLYKLSDNGTASAQEICLSRLADISPNESIHFSQWSHDLFMDYCILCGCDYLKNIPGIGPSKLNELANRYRNGERLLTSALDKCQDSAFDKDAFRATFEKAQLVFRHARVYDSKSKMLVYLREPPSPAVEQAVIALFPDIPEDALQEIAEGRMDPVQMISNDHLPPVSNRREERTITPSPSSAQDIRSYFVPGKSKDAQENEKNRKRDRPVAVFDDSMKASFEPSPTTRVVSSSGTKRTRLSFSPTVPAGLTKSVHRMLDGFKMNSR